MEETGQTLVQQPLQMSEQRQKTMDRMMRHMGRHMSGDDKERARMMNCPMMNQESE